jgi:hypothetical protein
MKYSKEQIENVLAKARAINTRAIHKEECSSKKTVHYCIPDKPIKVLADSAETGKLEEFELLFTRKAHFSHSNTNR